MCGLPAPKAGKPKPGTSGGGASIWPEGLGQSRWAAAPSCSPPGAGLPASPQHPVVLGAPPWGSQPLEAAVAKSSLLEDKTNLLSLENPRMKQVAAQWPCVCVCEHRPGPGALTAVDGKTGGLLEAACPGPVQVRWPLGGRHGPGPPHGLRGMADGHSVPTHVGGPHLKPGLARRPVPLPASWARAPSQVVKTPHIPATTVPQYPEGGI